MGMYTDFCLKVNLRRDTPAEVIDLLKFMASAQRDVDWGDLLIPDNPLFGETRWDYMLVAEYGKASVAGDESTGWTLAFRSSFKNYDGEIQHFLDWIMPYVDAKPGQFLGYWHYEEDDFPNLIYAPGGGE